MRHEDRSGEWDALALAWRGDFADRVPVAGRLHLTDEERQELDVLADSFWNEARHIGVLHRGGHAVDASLASKVRQWTACSRVMTVGGKRIFVLCNYPASWGVRLYYMGRSFAAGIPLRRFLGAAWKRRVEERSVIPTFAWNRTRMVAMPFIEASVASDVLREGQNHRHPLPSFGWTSQISDAERLEVIAEIGALLRRIHDAGRTWGDANLENVLLNAKREPMFVDPETAYVGIGMERQKQYDLHRLKASARQVHSQNPDAAESAVERGYARAPGDG